MLIPVLLYLHVLAAVCWLGGGLFTRVVVSRVILADQTAISLTAERFAKLAGTFFSVSGGLTVLLGLILAGIERRTEFSILGLAFALALIAMFAGATIGRRLVPALVAATSDAERAALRRNIAVFATTSDIALVVALALMISLRYY